MKPQTLTRTQRGYSLINHETAMSRIVPRYIAVGDFFENVREKGSARNSCESPNGVGFWSTVLGSVKRRLLIEFYQSETKQ